MSLAVLRWDIVVWLDSEVVDFDPAFVTGLVVPLAAPLGSGIYHLGVDEVAGRHGLTEAGVRLPDARVHRPARRIICRARHDFLQSNGLWIGQAYPQVRKLKQVPNDH